MFGVGTGEVLLILVIAMLVVGPERMVSFAKQMGEWVAKFRAQTDSVTSEFKEALSLDPEALLKDVISEAEEVKATVSQVAAEARTAADTTESAQPSEIPVAASARADAGRGFAEGETSSTAWKPEPVASSAPDDDTAVAVELVDDAQRAADHAEPTVLDGPVVVWEEDAADSDTGSDHREG
jgi:sec-independent protein translocase protein TatB